MNIACGTDIVYIPKIKDMLGDDQLVKRFFHQNELTNSDPAHLAGIIAAKEAFFKALGMIPKFLDVQITHEKSGRPKLLSSYGQKYKLVDISISHDQDYAVAFVVLSI